MKRRSQIYGLNSSKVLVAWVICIGSLLTLPGKAFSQCPTCPPHTLPPGKEQEKIYIWYFYQKEDPEYAKTTRLLKAITTASDRFGLIMKDMSKPESKELREVMNRFSEIFEEIDMHTPAIFTTKEGVFTEYFAIQKGVRVLVTKQPKGFQTFSRWVKKSLRTVKLLSIIILGGALYLIVPLAGLIDGINPCALSVLIFFVTAISPTLKERKAILIGGLGFIIGSFIAYFTIGLGLLRITQNLFFSTLSGWFYIFIGLVALLLGGISLVDFYKARTGHAKKMTLQLPSRAKKTARNLIKRYSASAGVKITAGFILGSLVSLLEFPCTGQVYFPIVILIGNPWSGANSLLYLVLYNISFIMPLMLIITASAFLISSQKLVSIFSRHIASTKLLIACLFFIIAVYMFGLL